MVSFGRWQFDFSNPWLIVLAVLLLVSLLLSLHRVAKRLFHRAPVRAVVVMTVNTIAFGVVFLLLLEPRFSQAVERSVVLVTEGADMSGMSHADMASLYIAPGAVTSTAERQALVAANWLLDTAQMTLREASLSALEIRGYGLEQDQWKNFPGNLQIDFAPPFINGFTEMRWQRFLIEGQTLTVSGRYQGAAGDGIIQLKLIDPADNVVDEIRVKDNRDFHLTTRVKTPGYLAYRLQAWGAKDLLSEQLLPLEASPGSRLDIMVEQSAPSFETRALKNHAAVNGHRLRLNTVVSKDRVITQSVNLPPEADTRFSPQILAGTDMLIMDGRALTNLTPIRRQWLADAVEAGLGLLVLADSALLEDMGALEPGLLNGFQLASLTGTQTMVTPRLRTGNRRTLETPLPVAAMRLSADNADVLVDDTQGRKLVIRRAKGLGFISVSLISHSHDWLTAGQQANWGDYWSTLFASTARQRGGSYLLPQAETEFYRLNKRIAVCAIAAGNDSSVLIKAIDARENNGTLELELAVDRLGSPRRCAYFWPMVSGWHQFQLLSNERDSVLDEKAFYVFKPEQWLSQHRDQRVRATRVRQENSKASTAETETVWKPEPLKLFWLWLTLVLSCSFLWLERKLDIT